MDNLEPIIKMNRDMLKAMSRDFPGGVTNNEARYLVDTYYSIQKSRMRNLLQTKGLERDAVKAGTEPEPHEMLDWFVRGFSQQEDNIKKVLAWYVSTHPMAWFFENTLGVGPVLAAGLLAHIDITQCPTVGHIWNFAGLNPAVTWDKGHKRPWNANLKTIAWKISDSFVKLSGRQDSFYSRLYKERKTREWQKNLAGDYQAEAARSMEKKKYRKTTDQYAWYNGQCSPELARSALEEGKTPTAASCKAEAGGIPMLSPGHIESRAKRYAVKIFLSHLHECWYRQEMGQEPAKPFAIAILNHAHYLPPPQLAGFNQAAA